jgi:arylsulfatase A-like enzyme
MLADAGYQTVGIGKMHYHPQRNGHGFETLLLDESGRVEAPDFVSDYRKWFNEVAPDHDPDKTGIGWNSHRAAPYALDEHLHPTTWTGDRAVEFLEHYDGERPFFLKVSFARPHSPYEPPQRYWDMYEGRNDIPQRVLGDWCDRHAQSGKQLADDLWQGDLGEDLARLARVGYYGNITMIDDQIGRIFKVLDDRGIMDNTLILMTSDHGDMLGDHHLWRKTYGYEASARVPMFIRWGKVLAADENGESNGLVFSQPVELRDIMPTFLDAAGVDYDPLWFDGRSLLSLVRDTNAPWREYIDLEHSTCYAPENNWTGLTDGRIKYIFYAPEAREQLFDLTVDPDERYNLAAQPEHRATLERWRGRMIEHLQERGEPYVKDGQLLRRPQGIVRSPNYPN